MPLACFKRDTYCARALNSNRFSGKILGGLKQKHKKQLAFGEKQNPVGT